MNPIELYQAKVIMATKVAISQGVPQIMCFAVLSSTALDVHSNLREKAKDVDIQPAKPGDVPPIDLGNGGRPL